MSSESIFQRLLLALTSFLKTCKRLDATGWQFRDFSKGSLHFKELMTHPVDFAKNQTKLFLMCGRKSLHLSSVKSIRKIDQEGLMEQHRKAERLETPRHCVLFYKSCAMKQKPWDVWRKATSVEKASPVVSRPCTTLYCVMFNAGVLEVGGNPWKHRGNTYT